MKRAALLSALCLVVFFSCEEDDFDLFDSGLSQNAVEQKCVRYVDRDIEEPGDGLSWEGAFPTVEEAIESAKEEVGEEKECEVRVKGEVENKNIFAALIPLAGNIKILDGFKGIETEHGLQKADRFFNNDEVATHESAFRRDLSENENQPDFSTFHEPGFSMIDDENHFELESRTYGPCECNSLDVTDATSTFYSGGSTNYLTFGRNSSENLQFYVDDFYAKIKHWQDGEANDHHFIIEAENAGAGEDDIRFRTDGSDRLTINEDGNVGIGTTSPGNALDVCGTIRAEEIIVDTGWCDFVFEDDYDLMTLDKVENYIKENNHLPGIPTAKEIESSGVSLGDAHAALLQKVEELTLYLIEQNKELKAQKEEIKELKSQIASRGR